MQFSIFKVVTAKASDFFGFAAGQKGTGKLVEIQAFQGLETDKIVDLPFVIRLFIENILIYL